MHVPAADLEDSDADDDATAAGGSSAAAGDGAADGADGQTRPKPRTRRGSRGGRNRKRKTPAGETAANGAEPTGDGVAAVVEAQADVAAAHTEDPSSETPATETPAPEAPARPRPARQPRARTAPAASPASAPPAGAAEGEPGYVPMSEWLDDFDR